MRKFGEFFKKPSSWLVVAFIVIFALGMCSERARAEGVDLRVGLGFGATNDNEWIVQEIMLTDRDWYASVLRTGDDRVLPDTWRFAVGYRVDWREDKRLAPYARFGFAYWLDQPRPVVSENLTYDMAVGLRFWQIMDLEWAHNSTAGRSEFNDGNDNVVLSFVLPFF